MKKKSLRQATITAITVVGLLACFTACNDKISQEAQLGNTDSTSIISVHENNSAVNSFVAFANDEEKKMSLDHTYSSEAINKLAEAVKGMASEIGYNLQGDVEKARECAAKITENPNASTHADDIRKATDILSASLKNMQVSKYPQLENEANALKEASASINPEVLTLNQKFEILSFFSKAADLLNKMN